MYSAFFLVVNSRHGPSHWSACETHGSLSKTEWYLSFSFFFFIILAFMFSSLHPLLSFRLHSGRPDRGRLASGDHSGCHPLLFVPSATNGRTPPVDFLTRRTAAVRDVYRYHDIIQILFPTYIYLHTHLIHQRQRNTVVACTTPAPYHPPHPRVVMLHRPANLILFIAVNMNPMYVLYMTVSPPHSPPCRNCIAVP